MARIRTSSQLFLLLLLVTPGWSQFLFHGTSIVIYPSSNSTNPKDSTFVAANFFSYATPEGYFSFGWWLPAVPGANSTHCVPRPDHVDWIEYTTAGNCTETTCRVHAVNYMTSDPTTPYIDEDYAAFALDIGNEEHGHLALSYFDREGGGYGVGSRKVLSGDDVDRTTAHHCQMAFQTLLDLSAEWKAPLSFQLTNPCQKAIMDDVLQRPMGSHT